MNQQLSLEKAMKPLSNTKKGRQLPPEPEPTFTIFKFIIGHGGSNRNHVFNMCSSTILLRLQDPRSVVSG